MDEKALIELVADILQVDASQVALDDDLKDAGWDSLANVEFIANVDETVGVTVDADELSNAATVRDLHALVSAGSTDAA
ncbi:hypothetical protein GCM10010458_09770 [Microbacterium luteolum]|uniref:Acyl carrier protein n=1 Tax=Microbacterium luteolum TaxID=69367 RepID=A0ABY7XNL5_MICLT|nr:acyl carrier protein [Microbacterium luteolum]WDM43738.1 acyl carrier protein [Microbacterium luteolum]